MLLFLVNLAGNAQYTQNNKFAISWQYFKKKMRDDEFDFWYEYKHQSFLQADTIIFDGHSQSCRKYQKIISLQYYQRLFIFEK